MLAMATRFFDKESPSRLGVVTEFVRNAHKIADWVLVAVNDRADVTGALDAIHELYLPCVEEFDVQPWGYVAALNALLYRASELGAHRILFASAEVKINRDVVLALDNEMDRDSSVLVVGAVMPGHLFHPGCYHTVSNALATPWNTCALWSVEHLAKTGFLLISEGGPEKNKGMEEVAVIATAQNLNPCLKAILKKVPGVSWDTSDWDEQRLLRHREKMASKNNRALLQIRDLGIFSGVIFHK